MAIESDIFMITRIRGASTVKAAVFWMDDAASIVDVREKTVVVGVIDKKYKHKTK